MSIPEEFQPTKGSLYRQIVKLEAENGRVKENWRRANNRRHEHTETIKKLKDENKALKEFIKSIKCQLDVMSAKL